MNTYEYMDFLEFTSPRGDLGLRGRPGIVSSRRFTPSVWHGVENLIHVDGIWHHQKDAGHTSDLGWSDGGRKFTSFRPLWGDEVSHILVVK